MTAVDPRIGTKIVLYQIYVRSVDLSRRLVSEHRGGAGAVPGGARGGAAHLPSDRLKRSEGRQQRWFCHTWVWFSVLLFLHIRW